MAQRRKMNVTTVVRGVLAFAAVGLTAVSPQAHAADVSRGSNLTTLQTVDFQIERGEIVSSNQFAFIAEILGASITNGNARVPATAQLMVDGARVEPWGNFFQAQQGNVNLPGRRGVYLHPTVLEEGAAISVAARSYLPRYDQRWRRYVLSPYISANTAFESDYVKVLRDGDAVPNISGFNGQGDASAFVSDYVKNGRIRLHKNQVIYLFELGASDLNSAAADFQDLVMIVTLAESVEALDEVVKGPELGFD